MNFKRLLALLLALILCFCLISCKSDSTNSSESGSAENNAGPLLYRVSDNNGNILWLFGSIHVGREDYYPLPDYVMDAFEDAESLAVEADILAFEKNLSLQSEALSYLAYTDNSTIKDHIPEDLYKEAVKILKELKGYNRFLNYYCPMFWSSMIDSLLYEELGAETNLGIDRYLLKEAKKDDKTIHEIESVEFQYRMMANFSEELQIILLQESINSYNDSEGANEALEILMDLWNSGDEKAFIEYFASDTEDLTDEEMELYEEYNKAMIIDRNISMTDFAEEALKDGEEMFICVGAAHVIGEDAMVDLLRERGYKVECIKN